MAQFKPVSISKGGFAFCRTVIALLLWIGVIFQAKEFVVAVFIIMLLSAILKVEKAPLIMLYKYTIGRFKKDETVIVDEKGIYVSHLVGAIFALVCVVLLYSGLTTIGWGVTIIFAILQTSGAFGFCSVLKLYNCMNNGTCCRVGKLAKKVKNNA